MAKRNPPREVIETYAGQVSFFVPEAAYAEAEEHLPALFVNVWPKDG
jgi:hypothetical protein